MVAIVERIRGRIVGYDERRRELLIRAPYDDFSTMDRREYKEVDVLPIDSRPLSDRQRRCCYAMLNAIAEWSGEELDALKDHFKLDFIARMEEDMELFSLSNARMSVVAAFQGYLARFIVANDVPTRKPMLDYVDDIEDYVYQCVIHKKCPVCGRRADLHHIDAVGMGRDRDEIIHEGLEVMSLCREHHTEIHTIGKAAFLDRYHLTGGVIADKTICRIYGLRTKRKARKHDAHV